MMMELLLATVLTCSEAKGVVKKFREMNVEDELIEVVKQSTTEGCFENERPEHNT